MIMKAKDMFEELGYQQEVDANKYFITYHYIKIDKEHKTTIEFMSDSKYFTIYQERTIGKNTYKIQCASVEFKWLKAINKQCEELGWLI